MNERELHRIERAVDFAREMKTRFLGNAVTVEAAILREEPTRAVFYTDWKNAAILVDSLIRLLEKVAGKEKENGTERQNN